MDDYENTADETYYLKDFIFDTKKVPHPTILLVGKRFAGKSTASVSVAKHFNMPRWAAWCGTKDTEDYWAEKFESPATVWGPDEKGKTALIRIIRFQQKKVRLYKKHLKKPFPRKYEIGLIFDDVTSKREFRRGEILEDLFSNGRHYKAVIIISCQYIKQLPPAVRTNTDYLFMLHNTKRTIRILYEEYVENPDEFTMFLDLLRYVTSQRDDVGEDLYNALVYDNVVKTYKLDEMFKIYRSPPHFDPDTIILGDESWRKYNQDHYRDEEEESERREYRKKKRLQRLAQHRQKQLLKRRQYQVANAQGLDVDYFSDSDESDISSDEEEGTDLMMLRTRKGQKVNVRISKGASKQKLNITTNTTTPTLNKSSLEIPLTNKTSINGTSAYNTQTPNTQTPNTQTYGTSGYGTSGYNTQTPNTQTYGTSGYGTSGYNTQYYNIDNSANTWQQQQMYLRQQTRPSYFNQV